MKFKSQDIFIHENAFENVVCKMLWRHHKHWKRYCVTGIKLKGVAVIFFICHVLWSLLWLCNHSITFMILLTGAFIWLECAAAVAEKYKLSNHVFTVWDVSPCLSHFTWWRHQMETFSAVLSLCAGNSPVSGEFPAQRPVTRSFDLFFDLCLNNRLSKQLWGWWFETPSCPLWRHCNHLQIIHLLDNVPSNKSGWLWHDSDKWLKSPATRLFF